jgi:DtxR family Mn-dependent transcriptional regulator
MKTATRARQDYVKALYAIGGAKDVVSTSQLAARLHVSMPSATNMLRRLAADGLVRLAPGTGARLSVSGRRLALELVRRHRILETFLVRTLELDWSEAHEDAEVLEHHISDRVLEAIDRLVQHPTEDPHGHPIPDSNGRIAPRALRRIASLVAGEHGTVREIRDGDRARMASWKKSGLVPGAGVSMRSVNVLDDVYEVEVNGAKIVTGSEGLDGIWVEAGKKSRRGTAG